MTAEAPGTPDVFYPIVPDLNWLARIVPMGVRTVQLRIKDARAEEIRRQIRASIAICANQGCQLIVNDYWREAIELGANFVHLGQEDLASADLAAIKAAGLRLGVSTHNPAQLAAADATSADYLAVGPVFATTSKERPDPAIGLDGVRQARQLTKKPLVAIGGITRENFRSVIAAGADSVAVISDLVRAPKAAAEDFLRLLAPS